MTDYFRPIACVDPARPGGAWPLAGGWTWFDRVELLRRGRPPRVIEGREVPDDILERLSSPRPDVAGLAMSEPNIMGILNVTPDSFSEGSRPHTTETAIDSGRAMAAAGADMIDVGGESTRPGAEEVPEAEELARVAGVVPALFGRAALSIDTRKARVAEEAVRLGAELINDVSAGLFDEGMVEVMRESGAAVCLMHSRGTPKTMQNDLRYEDVLLEVYDYLEDRVAALEEAGVPRQRVVVDPGIGFGKTREHNLALIRGVSLFHGLGVPLLLGLSRKGFIGRIGEARDPRRRFPGSWALAQVGLQNGVQLLRVHDVSDTMQAMRLWRAASGMGD